MSGWGPGWVKRRKTRLEQMFSALPLILLQSRFAKGVKYSEDRRRDFRVKT